MIVIYHSYSSLNLLLSLVLSFLKKEIEQSLSHTIYLILKSEAPGMDSPKGNAPTIHDLLSRSTLVHLEDKMDPRALLAGNILY